MRIIGGKHKGKAILPPNGYKARPTTDFAKEGLFNVLDNEYELEGLKVLDLFGGTGAISYEFASRGADRVYWTILLSSGIMCSSSWTYAGRSSTSYSLTLRMR